MCTAFTPPVTLISPKPSRVIPNVPFAIYRFRTSSQNQKVHIRVVRLHISVRYCIYLRQACLKLLARGIVPTNRSVRPLPSASSRDPETTRSLLSHHDLFYSIPRLSNHKITPSNTHRSKLGDTILIAMGADGRNSGEAERKLEGGGASEKQQSPPPATPAAKSDGGLHPAVVYCVCRDWGGSCKEPC